MYPPLPAYAVPNDDQRASTNATTAAIALDPPPSTSPDYTPLENGSASATAEDATSLHPPAISCSQGDDSDLPLYQNVSERLPAYTSRPSPSSFGGHEPRTLPMILFKIGFCTFSPPSPPPSYTFATSQVFRPYGSWVPLSLSPSAPASGAPTDIHGWRSNNERRRRERRLWLMCGWWRLCGPGAA